MSPWTIIIAERGINWGDERLTAKFWSNVVPEPTSGCWLWIGRMLRGYGRYDNGHDAQAHRVAYTALVGPIGDLLTVDHTCNVSCCQNPAHMELVTSEENTRRRSARLPRCVRGHEKPPGDCVECRRARSRKYKAKKRQLMAVP